MISFNDIPGNLRVPFVAAEFDASGASQGPALLAYRGLIIGQKTSAGTGAANTLYRVTSAAQVAVLGGRGSMLHRQAIAWFAANKATEAWIGVLEDDSEGVAAHGTITVTGPATAAGTIALCIGGVRVPVGVAVDDTADDIAAAIAAAITANGDLGVTATATDAVVTVTYRHKGEVGNGFDMRANYRDGEALPAGVTLAFVALASGTSNPALDDLIAALGDTWFHVWTHPYVDATSLDALETELTSRFGPLRMIDGVAVTSAVGTHSALVTKGDSRNSGHSLIVGQPGQNPVTPAEEFAAEAAALIAYYGNADPARPFQTLAMSHALPPAESDLFTIQERNLLLYDGVATTRVAAGGVVQLERMITTYQEDGAGSPDTAYLDVNTPLTLLYMRYSFRARMQSKYPRHKLGSDGTRFGPGQAIITPKLGKAEAISWFRDMEELGLAENFDQFKRDLVVERNVSDPNRLDFLLPPDLINQLIVTGAKIAFRL